MLLSNSEYYEMIFCVGASDGSRREASRLYFERFIDGRPVDECRQLPSLECFRKMVLRLQQSCSFHGFRREGRRRRLLWRRTRTYSRTFLWPYTPERYISMTVRHFARPVRAYLDTRYDQWIGRGGPTARPPRSPDLTPLDFFLWGYVKSMVYSDACGTRETQSRIINAFTTITPQMLRNVRSSIYRRVHLCIEQGGIHFEPLL